MEHAGRASGGVYCSARLAAGFAFARPPVHQQVGRLIGARLGLSADRRCARALDVGCGAGLSTAPLSDLARAVVGVDPAAAMLTYHRAVAPAARFAVARAEALPFADAAFGLVTCAGALNYADVGRALREIARVLTEAGTLVVYDFSGGRRCRDGHDLEGWFAAFEARYPYPPGYALDVSGLDYEAAGLRLASLEAFEIPLVLAPDDYLAYVLSETNVQRAVTEGMSEEDIRAWCRHTLEPIVGGAPIEVLFDGYLACISKHRAPAAA
jgi:SAM-dependent methyltransferase